MNAKIPPAQTTHNQLNQGPAGLGRANPRVAIYLANRPPLDDYPELQILRPMLSGELQHIVAHTGNHWRKVFSVYAKLVFEWAAQPTSPVADECHNFNRWQEYRDQRLLQADSAAALMFSAPSLTSTDCVHIIAGKTYAQQLGLAGELVWLDAHFAVNLSKRLIVCPYLDYRQLSNERISRLIAYAQRFIASGWGDSCLPLIRMSDEGCAESCS